MPNRVLEGPGCVTRPGEATLDFYFYLPVQRELCSGSRSRSNIITKPPAQGRFRPQFPGARLMSRADQPSRHRMGPEIPYRTAGGRKLY